MMDYILRSSSVSGLELPDVEKDQARALAGELATTLVEDRLNILIAAAGMVEHHVGRILWRGVGDVARSSTAVVEVFGAGEIPIVASLPESQGVVTITTVRKWNDSTEAYESVSYKLRPQSRILLDADGVYEIVATVLPPTPAARGCYRRSRTLLCVSDCVSACSLDHVGGRECEPATARRSLDSLGC